MKLALRTEYVVLAGAKNNRGFIRWQMQDAGVLNLPTTTSAILTPTHRPFLPTGRKIRKRAYAGVPDSERRMVSYLLASGASALFLRCANAQAWCMNDATCNGCATYLPGRNGKRRSRYRRECMSSP